MRLICPNCGAQYEVDARVIPDTGRDVQCSNCGHTWFQQPAHLDNELAQEKGYELPTDPDSTDEHDDAQAGDEPDVPEFEDASEPDEPERPTSPDVEPEFTSYEPDPDPEPEPAPLDEPEHEDSQDAEEEPSLSAAVAAALSPESADDDAADLEEDVYEEEDESLPSAAASQAGLNLKDSVRDILRAEVEFDQSMRHTESGPIESQPDLGLEEPEQAAAKKSLRDRMARLRGLDPADPGIAAGSVAAASGKRRDLLPDIEEINSTLSASSERDDDGTVPDEDTRRARAERSGFRSVLLLFVLIAAMLIALYVLAPMIAAKVPSLAGSMDAYVALANSFRSWLDQIMSAASERLNMLLGQLNS